jgi:LacI family transcriptional regulator
VSGETRLLALLVSDFTNPFYPQLAKSIEDEADRAGYTVVICNTRDRAADARRHLTRLLGQGLDGVIHASVGRDEEAVLSVIGDDRRVVFTNRPPKSRSVSSVVSNNVEGAAELTRHLLSLGHRRIGFVGGPSYARNATERLRGFRDAMAEVPGTRVLVQLGEFARESGEHAVQKWLQDDPTPTAIIAINDSVALGAMEALIRLGLRMPDDVALAGFDGTDLAASPVMGLTSVDQHSDKMGRLAVEVLLRQLRSEAFAPTQDVLPTQLLIRRSTQRTNGVLPDGIERSIDQPASLDLESRGNG